MAIDSDESFTGACRFAYDRAQEFRKPYTVFVADEFRVMSSEQFELPNVKETIKFTTEAEISVIAVFFPEN
jgi:hypothetical protein